MLAYDYPIYLKIRAKAVVIDIGRDVFVYMHRKA